MSPAAKKTAYARQLEAYDSVSNRYGRPERLL